MNNLDYRARVVFALLWALPACAQLVHAQAGPVQPYSAEFKITRVQTLANGATITRETKEVRVRDSQGRFLTATTQIPTSPDQPAMTFANVHDSVNHTESNWNSQIKRANVTKMPADMPSGTCWSTGSGGLAAGAGRMPPVPPPPATLASGGGVGSSVIGMISSGPVPASLPAPIRPVREDLGTDMMMGVEVHKYRITRTTPVGRIGNDRPLIATDETWSAPSLGITVRQISDDPQTGRTTRELVSLDLNEPDPSVFQPPADYEVTTQEMRMAPCGQRP